jgi:hypothetical protein
MERRGVRFFSPTTIAKMELKNKPASSSSSSDAAADEKKVAADKALNLDPKKRGPIVVTFDNHADKTQFTEEFDTVPCFV